MRLALIMVLRLRGLLLGWPLKKTMRWLPLVPGHVSSLDHLRRSFVSRGNAGWLEGYRSLDRSDPSPRIFHV
jgi:hypothetical protein